MANFGFSKFTRREKVAFFQSSLPYLNNHAVTLFSAGKTRRWRSGEPQASTKKILTFCSGNYGIYFSLFSQELRKKENATPPTQDASTLIVILPNGSTLSFVSDFYISKANLEILSDINELKSVTRDWLSTLALVKPKCSIKQLYQTRSFSTSAVQYLKSSQDKDAFQYTPEPVLSQPEQVLSQPEPKIVLLEEPVEEPFESSFLKSQTASIVKAFNTYTSPSDLNVIYPLYQALKRNNLALSSIHEYNIVLKSIAMRSLDSDGSVASTESKLSCLLTVYQDILQACCKNSRCHPDAETYNVVLTSIFACTRQCIVINKNSNRSQQSCDAAVAMASQFFEVGSKLYLSLSARSDLSTAFLPDFLFCLNAFPHSMSKEVAEKAFALKESKVSDSRFYSELIALSKSFASDDTLALSKKESYDFISSVFENFKAECSAHPDMAESEYDVYASLIEALISNGNLPIATKFLDQILVDHKHDLESGDAVAGGAEKVSELLSVFVTSLIGSGSSVDLFKGYSLLSKFNDVYYLPEISVETYNDIINRFAAEYVQLEMAKQSSPVEDLNRQQYEIYTNMWKLYNRAAIRKDFQECTSRKNLKAGSSANCRESLLSLSIDLGDHSNVSRLIKEVLVKNHAISDWNVSRKLLQYLRNGATTFNNSYYQELMWSVAEQQGARYVHDITELNNFLSHHAPYLIIDGPNTFHKLMNSVIVFKALEGFKLEKDNSHGVMTIMMFLINEAHRTHLPINDLFKVLQYQSYLVNEFEDTENHYLELCPDLQAFKKTLYASFSALVSSQSTDLHVSSDIQQACSSLGLGEFSGRVMENSAAGYSVDLSAHLNTNYHKGVEMFLEYFKSGYSFNENTWQIIINANFVVDILEPEKVINTQSLVQRLLASDVNVGQLVCKLIDLQNDKVNIKLLKFLVTPEGKDVANLEGVMLRLSEFAKQTNNCYFISTMADNFQLLVTMNGEKTWIANVFEKLNNLGKHSTVDTITSRDQGFYVDNLDLTKKPDELLLANVMTALLNLGQHEKIGAILRRHFSGADGNKVLLQSDNLLQCLLEYYVSVGSYGTILDKFASLANRSAALRQRIQFASLLSAFTGQRVKLAKGEAADSQNLALDILNENNLKKMKLIYEHNKALVADKEVFLNQLVLSLSKSAKLLDEKFYAKINARFESVIKFCKVLGLTKISTESLVQIIHFLTITRSSDLLNILFNKFLVNNTLVSSLNFFFLRIDVPTARDASLLLNEFKAALTTLGDSPNLAALKDHEHSMAH